MAFSLRSAAAKKEKQRKNLQSLFAERAARMGQSSSQSGSPRTRSSSSQAPQAPETQTPEIQNPSSGPQAQAILNEDATNISDSELGMLVPVDDGENEPTVFTSNKPTFMYDGMCYTGLPGQMVLLPGDICVIIKEIPTPSSTADGAVGAEEKARK